MNHDVVWHHSTRLDVSFYIIYRFSMIHQLFALKSLTDGPKTSKNEKFKNKFFFIDSINYFPAASQNNLALGLIYLRTKRQAK